MPLWPVAGSNLDYTNTVEALNALQRNTQIQRAITSGAAVNITATVIYAVIPAQLSVQLKDSTISYNVAAPGLVLPFGAPTGYAPPGGQVTITPVSTNTFVTVLYK